MKRITALLLMFALAVALCSCGTPEQEPEETRIDNYTYDEEKEIKDYISTAMSYYGFNYSIYASEDDGKISVSIYLSRAPGGAEEVFADTVEWAVPIVKQAKEKYQFEIKELRISFSLYQGSLDGDSCGAISYKTEDLTAGLLVNAATKENFFTKNDVPYEQVREYLCE